MQLHIIETIQSKLCLLFLGNKRDMEQLREVNISDAKNFAQQYNMIDAIETSAKENTNVEQVFKEMATVSKKINCALKLLVAINAII